MFDICEVLLKARENEASDVYLKAGIAPGFRKNGNVKQIPYRVITGDDMLECLLKITTAEQRNILEEQGEICFSYEEPLAGRYRVTVFKSRGMVSMVFHVVLTVSAIAKKMTAQREAIREIAEKRKGLVLFAGDAGSGRTTSMAAVIHEINRNCPVHIMTLENPVEVLQESDMAVVSQRESGTDYADEADAIDGALKEAVDVLVYDGGLDGKLISKLCQVSGNGPLVLASTYGNNIAAVVANISTPFSTGEKDEIRKILSEALQAVVVCKWVETAEGLKQEWEVISVDARIKNQIRNCL